MIFISVSQLTPFCAKPSRSIAEVQRLLRDLQRAQSVAKSMIAHKIEAAIVKMSSIKAVAAISTIAFYCALKGG